MSNPLEHKGMVLVLFKRHVEVHGAKRTEGDGDSCYTHLTFHKKPHDRMIGDNPTLDKSGETMTFTFRSYRCVVYTRDVLAFVRDSV